jgi:hypothetical protein
MFEWVLHSGTRQKILKMFFQDLSKPLYGLSISKRLKGSPGTTHRELNAMVTQGILLKKREGALVLYRLNTHHPFFAELKKSIFPKKKSDRALFVSDLRLSLATSPDLLKDLEVLINYAKSNASELVLLGDTFDLINSDLFQTMLFLKPLFERFMALSHEMKLFLIPGRYDAFLDLLSDQHLKPLPFHILPFYHHEKLQIAAKTLSFRDDDSRQKNKKEPGSLWKTLSEKLTHLPQEGLSLEQHKLLELCHYSGSLSSHHPDQQVKQEQWAKEVLKKTPACYAVFGQQKNAFVKETDYGVYFSTGSFVLSPERSFVEIDEEGGAVVKINEVR